MPGGGFSRLSKSSTPLDNQRNGAIPDPPAVNSPQFQLGDFAIDEYKPIKVVVIGAGNSSIDICQDLALGGVRSVTMVQRSSSAVMSRKCGKEDLETIFLPDQPAVVGDVKWAAIPLGFRRETMINSQEEQWAREKELNDKLRRAGLKLNLGEDGEGVLLLIFERAGGKFEVILRWSPRLTHFAGYCGFRVWTIFRFNSSSTGIDKGATELFASGKIKVKQGIQPTALSKHTLIFADGSELPADAVIFWYVNKCRAFCR